MGLHKLVRTLAPVAGLVVAAALSGCDAGKVEFDTEGVPLAELDMTGDPPTGIVLAGSDKLVVSQGDEFEIEVTGTDAARERMRFARDGQQLAIHRQDLDFGDDIDVATVAVTLPSVGSIVIAGSGEASARGLSDDASVVISGSGTLDARDVDVASLTVVITGSGRFTASGRTEQYSLNIAGSGSADTPRLRVGSADVTAAGSGDAHFASDGEVSATIVGSGNVRVTGSARCNASTVGSGSLRCDGGTVNGE